MRRPLLIALPLFLLSCSSSQNTSPEEPATNVVQPDKAEETAAAQETAYEPDFPKIEEKRWLLSEYEYDGRTYRPERDFTLRVFNGQVSGNSGCNNYQASIRLRKDGTMAVGDVASTKKLCQGSMMQERRFQDILQNARSYSVNQLFLEINSELGKLSFRAQPEDVKE